MKSSTGTLKFLLILSFLNTIGLIVISPFDLFENNDFVSALPLISGIGCGIQLLALILARFQWQKITFEKSRTRTIYIVVATVSVCFTILWIATTFFLYFFLHSLTGIGPMNFGQGN
jgi:hypothetical protein